MKARKIPESSVSSEVRASTSSQTTASEGDPSAARSALLAPSEICESISSSGDRPGSRHPELFQVLDENARVLAGDVAEDHVSRRLLCGALEEDEVAGRGRGLQQRQHLLGEVMRDDDPQVDHRVRVSPLHVT